MTVRDTQMVRDQKKFENHCTTVTRLVDRVWLVVDV